MPEIPPGTDPFCPRPLLQQHVTGAWTRALVANTQGVVCTRGSIAGLRRTGGARTRTAAARRIALILGHSASSPRTHTDRGGAVHGTRLDALLPQHPPPPPASSSWCSLPADLCRLRQSAPAAAPHTLQAEHQQQDSSIATAQRSKSACGPASRCAVKDGRCTRARAPAPCRPAAQPRRRQVARLAPRLPGAHRAPPCTSINVPTC